MASLPLVREAIPEAKLVIFGAKLPFDNEGVENPGRINSREEMQNYLLNTDLVLAPALCDPFPVFPMEAMNFGVPLLNNPLQLQTMSINARDKIKNKLNWKLIGKNIAQTISEMNFE
ncbi:MAG: glycosyltransferase [Cyanobacteria bacterium P01_H01_bin.150]